MIGFAAPWALAGLLAAALPILLHLFARREPPTLVFPATRYLAETARARHRRLTLQHWLLLLVRTLLIATLVLAAAGPTWPGAGAGAHAPAALAIVLDNSLSSAATAGGTPVIDRLKAVARAALDQATPQDALWLVTADGSPRMGSREDLRTEIGRIEPSPARLDLGRAIQAARDAMAGDPRPQSVLLASDLQATALGAAEGRGPVTVARIEHAPVGNLGLSALDPGRQPWGPEGGALAIGVGGNGDSARTAALTVRIGGRAPRQQLVRGGATATSQSGALPPGWWLAAAELEADELRLDDRRETVVRVVPPASVSWSAEDRFLATALDVLLQNRRIVRGADLSIGLLGARRSIVLPPADPARVGAQNRALAARGIPWRFGDAVAAPLLTDSSAVIGRHRVLRRHPLVPSGGAPSGVLVTAAGAPWVVRSGDVVLVGSRLDPDWTDLPLAAGFVPFVDFLVNRAARGELTIASATPGEPVLLPDAATAIGRAGRRRDIEGGAALRTMETGVHFVLAGRDTIGAVAVSPDPRESDLAPADDGAIRGLWPGATIVSASRAPRTAFAAGGRTDLRGSFLWLAALLALADATLAGTRRRPSR
ncbi:MAG: vWA domain-containing protein [Gemmatimonadales bacterium]